MQPCITGWLPACQIVVFPETCHVRDRASTVHSPAIDGEPVQNILPELALSVSVVDASEAELDQLTKEEFQRPFNLETPPLFREVILAAPDIDAGVFTEMADGLKGKANRITLYASSKDYALEASRKVHGLLRAGDSEKMVVVDGVDSIDASLASTDVLGHGYVFHSSILFDIESLFRFGKPPSQRERLRVQQTGKLLYWMLDR